MALHTLNSSIKLAQMVLDSVAVKGRPFYLDMTNVGSKQTSNAYIGIDFGTSNSAVSFLSRETMDLLKTRSTNEDWLTLSDLITSLPYPLARTLNRFVGGSSSVHSHDSFMRALEFMEAAFGLLSYTAFLELCTIEPATRRLFKGFTQRSIGPLWALLRDSMLSLGKQALITAPARKLLEPKNEADINKVVSWFNQRKHQKAPEDDVNITSAISFIGNICNDIYKTSFFGYFESVQKTRFGKGYSGRYRIAHGPTQPFPLWASYKGDTTFADYQAHLLDVQRSQALCLEPLAFWDACTLHPGVDEPHLFLFDRVQGEKLEYKAVGYDCSISISGNPKYEELVEQLNSWKQVDPAIEKVGIAELIPPEDSFQ